MALLQFRALASSEAKRWKIISSRDASDNTFVYAVRSTRIYCRPSCPSRLARRANVEFFETPAQAEGAGYRSCKRCTPHLDASDDRQQKMARQACETIANALALGDNQPSLHRLAKDANLSSSYFHKTFKKVTGFTPAQYANTVKRGDIGLSNICHSSTEMNELPTLLEYADNTDILSDLSWVDSNDTNNININNPGDAIMTDDDLMNWDDFDIMMAAELNNNSVDSSIIMESLLEEFCELDHVEIPQ